MDSRTGSVSGQFQPCYPMTHGHTAQRPTQGGLPPCSPLTLAPKVLLFIWLVLEGAPWLRGFAVHRGGGGQQSLVPRNR